VRLAQLVVALLIAAAIASASAPTAGAIDPSNFTAHVDNPWLPFVPGTAFVYSGVKDGKPTRDVVTVTHQTALIEGVPCIAIHDDLFEQGRLEERTTDWYSQDRQGNVWYFGEATAELDLHGKVTSREGSWRAGVDGARPGIFMPGRPSVGVSGRQEYYKGHAEDHFRVVSQNATVRVPYLVSTHALETVEWTPLEPGVLDQKLYVRGIGNVKEASKRGPVERNVLVSVTHG